MVCFKVDHELLVELEEYARRKGITRSEAIRRALNRYIGGKPEVEVIRTRRIKIYKINF